MGRIASNVSASVEARAASAGGCLPAGGAVGRFDGKTVLLGVTGCIAAYKACEILRAIQKEGGRVKVVMTEHACEFVGPTTFRALSREPVAVGLFDDPSDPIHHVSLANECDVFLIAPCTANVAAKLACGLADDLLTTTALATRAPIVLAPAMNVGMYENPATAANLAVLRERGFGIVEADVGYLACGDVGRGRLADVDAIVDAAYDALLRQERAGDLAGMQVLVTAGPTVEPIDPVRFLSNRSSGKMGYRLAEAARDRGARVVLVSGPTALPALAGVELRRVSTAADMLEACMDAMPDTDIAVFAAAVADVRPVAPSPRKLKKGRDDDRLSSIELAENPDVLATCASGRRPGQTIVGFAAETEDIVANAQAKLRRKGADLIVANEVGEGIGFGTDDDKAWLVSTDGAEELPLLSKSALADAILDAALAARR